MSRQWNWVWWKARHVPPATPPLHGPKMAGDYLHGRPPSSGLCIHQGVRHYDQSFAPTLTARPLSDAHPSKAQDKSEGQNKAPECEHRVDVTTPG